MKIRNLYIYSICNFHTLSVSSCFTTKNLVSKTMRRALTTWKVTQKELLSWWQVVFFWFGDRGSQIKTCDFTMHPPGHLVTMKLAAGPTSVKVKAWRSGEVPSYPKSVQHTKSWMSKHQIGTEWKLNNLMIWVDLIWTNQRICECSSVIFNFNMDIGIYIYTYISFIYLRHATILWEYLGSVYSVQLPASEPFLELTNIHK